MNGVKGASMRVVFALSILWLAKGQKCRDDTGASVDWMIAYKMPILKNDPCSRLREGTGYIYITSKNHDQWKLSKKSINDSTSFVGHTLSGLYDPEKAKNFLYMMYNDDPPSCKATLNYAHAKGVVLTDGCTGVWLIHSSPRFPIEPVSTQLVETCLGKEVVKIMNKFFYPKSASKYGQSYLCLSLPHSEMDKVGLAMQVIRPKIYASNVPKKLCKKFPNLVEAIEGRYSKLERHKFEVRTLAGEKFVSYSKSKYFNKDLYCDWVAKDLHSPMEVESWRNGPKPLLSDYREKFYVLNVNEIDIKTEGHDMDFKNSQDHSKWAVTINSTNKVVCVGDINRMLSQYKRGGSTVCHEDEKLWKLFSKAVVQVQPESYDSFEKLFSCPCQFDLFDDDKIQEKVYDIIKEKNTKKNSNLKRRNSVK